MKTKLCNSEQSSISTKLLDWYNTNARDLPFRNTKDPYKIWICEIIFQQTRIEQGLSHYNNFIERFPDVESLYKADIDEILLYWKGLGYYSRAINLHKSAQQIMTDFHGEFPKNHSEILKLKGIGKYTAAAISSICFNENRPAVDGNFYRVLSRVFADNYDISNSKAFDYFSELGLRIIPNNQASDFNQAIMDLGSEVCKPKNPQCEKCPLQKDCLAFEFGKVQDFPIKTKKTKVEDLSLTYYFLHFQNEFIIQKRGVDFIWKNLYEFPDSISTELENKISQSETISHKLTHKNLTIQINTVSLESKKSLENYSKKYSLMVTTFEDCHKKSFPKPLTDFLANIEKHPLP